MEAACLSLAPAHYVGKWMVQKKVKLISDCFFFVSILVESNFRDAEAADLGEKDFFKASTLKCPKDYGQEAALIITWAKLGVEEVGEEERNG